MKILNLLMIIGIVLVTYVSLINGFIKKLNFDQTDYIILSIGMIFISLALFLKRKIENKK